MYREIYVTEENNVVGEDRSGFFIEELPCEKITDARFKPYACGISNNLNLKDPSTYVYTYTVNKGILTNALRLTRNNERRYSAQSLMFWRRIEKRGTLYISGLKMTLRMVTSF
jgi:hypothetical protein